MRVKNMDELGLEIKKKMGYTQLDISDVNGAVIDY